MKRKYAKTAFSGEGARLFAGRWNNPGFPVVYTAGSHSLAALEMLVHLDSSELLNQYVVAEIEIDPSLIVEFDFSLLPRNWRVDPAPARARSIGDEWLKERRSAVLKLPSAIIPSEAVLLLNPLHDDFTKIHFGKFESFQFDPRLVKRN